MKVFDISRIIGLKCARDGSGFAYVDAVTHSSIMFQPLDGVPLRRQVDLKSELEFMPFTWSRDAQQLAYSGGAGTYDAVALSLPEIR